MMQAMLGQLSPFYHLTSGPSASRSGSGQREYNTFLVSTQIWMSVVFVCIFYNNFRFVTPQATLQKYGVTTGGWTRSFIQSQFKNLD